MDTERLARLYRDHVASLVLRYDAILAAAGFDAVVIHSGSLQKRSEFDDQYWPLRATPHFQHWAPVAEPDCAMIILPGKTPKLARMRVTSFWEKPARPETEHYVAALDIVSIDAFSDVKRHLPQGKRIAFVGADRAQAAAAGIAEADQNPAALVAKLDKLRTTKTEYEILCLEEANRRAARGHAKVLEMFRAGDHSELTLHLAYLGATGQDDPETPYKNIVALGANAATLHHVSYGKQATGRGAESLLVDAGAAYQGYCSDITRTWVKGAGAEASAFEGLVLGVEKLQQRLSAAIAIGMPYEELHEESHRQVAAVLRDVGVVKLSVEEIVASGVSRAFFPHGLGHSLGLQCHDVGCADTKPRPDNPFLRNTAIIAEGQVFTIEPGVYFIEGLLEPLRATAEAASIDWQLVGQLAALGGVRIEDDLVVTRDAARNLTREFLPVGGGR